MKRVSGMFLSLLGILMYACSPVVYTDTAPEADFGAYETYAFLPSGEDEGDGTIYTEKIINEVQQEMEARGYELDPENPDLLVNVNTMYEEEEELQRVPVATTYPYYTDGFYTPATLEPYYYTGFATIPEITGYGIREIEYTEGTFVVDIIEAADREIVWRGWSETPIDPEYIDNSIRDYIDNIFEEYPVEPVRE
ncbi:DUF4136 domain-containing protein [Nafulsella turpanensis]|uniref:DUF4136 domain-containing protein n=1 Tax=Nafulsella turpanensis TaxID=1265690 RepID=UPI000348B9EB|nr:DUF4136 domain-containing protein [Nafulsella turpanensis]